MKLLFDDLILGGGPNYYLDDNYKSLSGGLDNNTIKVPRTDYSKSVSDFMSQKLKPFSGTLIGNNAVDFRSKKRDLSNKLRQEYTFTLIDDVVGLAPWYNASWTNRIAITMPKEETLNIESNIKLYLDLSILPDTFFSTVKSDGSDIVITKSDGITKLNRELVIINTGAKTGELHFRAPTITHVLDNVFYIYYGNAGAAEVNSTETWTDEDLVIQHFTQDPSGSAPQMIDSTDNNNDGTSNGTMTTGDLVDGKLGKALDFDGTDDVIIIDHNQSLDFGNQNSYSLSLWFKTATKADQSLTEKWGGLSTPSYPWALRGPLGIGTLRFAIFEDPINPAVDNIADLADDSWHHVVGIRDNANSILKIYIDSVLIGTTPDTTATKDVSNEDNLHIGARFSTGSQAFDGLIDEFRVRSGILTDNQISIEYNNQNDNANFFTVGGQETSSTNISRQIINDIYEFNGKIVDIDPNKGIISNKSNYNLQIYCADPFFKRLPNKIFDITIAKAGFIFPMVFPFVFTGKSNNLSIDYEGLANGYPLITITGPFTNLTIINETTGLTDNQFIYTGTVATGEIIVINPIPTDEVKIRKDGVSAVSNTNSNFDIFELVNGINNFTFIAEDNINNATTVTFEVSEAFMGI